MSALAGISSASPRTRLPLIKKILEPQDRKNRWGSLVRTGHQDSCRKGGPLSQRNFPAIERTELEMQFMPTEAEMPELIASMPPGLKASSRCSQAENQGKAFGSSFLALRLELLLAIFWIWRIIVGPIVQPAHWKASAASRSA